MPLTPEQSLNNLKTVVDNYSATPAIHAALAESISVLAEAIKPKEPAKPV